MQHFDVKVNNYVQHKDQKTGETMRVNDEDDDDDERQASKIIRNQKGR